jgi:hypothetical protein
MMDAMINTTAWDVQVQILTQRLATQGYSDVAVCKQRQKAKSAIRVTWTRGISHRFLIAENRIRSPGSLVEKAALRRVFSKHLGFPLSTVFPPMLHIKPTRGHGFKRQVPPPQKK